MKKEKFEFLTSSAEETIKLGKKIGRLLRPGDVVALEGGLGAGKTTLVKGMALGLGVSSERKVASPTYVIIHEYRARIKIFHLDWYRLEKVSGIDADYAEECFSSDAVTFVEWPERGRDLLPAHATHLRLKHMNLDQRSIRFDPSKKTRTGLINGLRRIM